MNGHQKTLRFGRTPIGRTLTGRRGFTIVEVLVVISIMVLLISVLLPSLQQARETARVEICHSNMRQSAVVVQTYAEENRQYLPYSTNNTGVQSQNHLRWVDLMNNVDSPNLSSLVPTGNLNVTNNTDGKMRRCPGGINLAMNINTNYSFGYNYITNVGTTNSITAENRFFFAPNQAWFPRDDTSQSNFPTPRRLDSIRKNLNLLMEAADAGTGNAANRWPENVGGSTAVGTIRFRHPNNSMNLVFLDGHAENWRGAEIANGHQKNLTIPLVGGKPQYPLWDVKDLIQWSQLAPEGTLTSYPWGDASE